MVKTVFNKTDAFVNVNFNPSVLQKQKFSTGLEGCLQPVPDFTLPVFGVFFFSFFLVIT